MIRLQNSVRAFHDPDFQRIQQIARMHPRKYKQNPELLTEFSDLVSKTFTFVPNWESNEITPTTYRLFGKKNQQDRQ